MTEETAEHIGSVRYVGLSMESGYMDACKSAQALVGIDEALRYFVGVQSSALRGTDFEIPVRIRKGSWEALIPAEIGTFIKIAAGLAGTAYLTTAAQKMASNDFKDVGFQQLFQKGLKAVQWALRLGKHVGSVTRRAFVGVQWRNGNTEIGIPNDSGELLFVPYEYFQMYEHMPASLLVKITRAISEERTLEVVVNSGSGESVVAVSLSERSIFCHDDDEMLFPELVDGMPFDEEGLVTRGNENANSLGFQYQGRILTCYPQDGSIVRFKSTLFLPARMVGTVSRRDKFGEPTERKPKIVFSLVAPLASGEDAEQASQALLFDDEQE